MSIVYVPQTITEETMFPLFSATRVRTRELWSCEG